MRPERQTRWILLALVAFAGYLVFRIFRPFLPAIAWAAIIAVALEPVYRRLVGWLGGRRWIAATAMSVLVAIFILIPSVIAIVQITDGLAQAHDWLQEQTAEGGAATIEEIRRYPAVAWVRDRLSLFVDLEKLDLRQIAGSALQSLGAAAAARTSSLVTEALQMILTVTVVLLMTAFFFLEGDTLVREIRRYLPLSEKDKDDAIRDLGQVTRSVFLGSMATALIQAILAGIGIAIVGLPSAVTFGAATFFAAFLPGGTALVWLPASAWLGLTGRPFKAIFLVLWGAALVSSADNVIRPLFIGRGVKIHTLLVFFGIFGGIIAFGLIGIFVGPLIITLFLFLLEVAHRELYGEEGPLEQTVSPGGNAPTT
jgi:predicted PurR-regulated permease PerM